MKRYITVEDALNAMCDNCDSVQAVCPHYPCKQYKSIEQLPSAQPERKKGKWFFSDTDFLTHCSNCGQSEWKGYCPTPEEATEWMPICPKCGADMREEKSNAIH